MKESTPYIIFALTQSVVFVAWLIKQNIDFNKKITKMETQIETLKEKDQEHSKQMDWVRQQLLTVCENLAVAKSAMENLLLKGLKTYRS